MLFYDRPDARYANLESGSQVDVAPTSADRPGLPIPASWQGRSLASLGPGAYSFHQTRLQTPAFAVLYRTGQAVYKYPYWSQKRREELYELNADPGEQRDLARTADPVLLEHLREKFREKLRDYRAQ